MIYTVNYLSTISYQDLDREQLNQSKFPKYDILDFSYPNCELNKSHLIFHDNIFPRLSISDNGKIYIWYHCRRWPNRKEFLFAKISYVIRTYILDFSHLFKHSSSIPHFRIIPLFSRCMTVSHTNTINVFRDNMHDISSIVGQSNTAMTI